MTLRDLEKNFNDKVDFATHINNLSMDEFIELCNETTNLEEKMELLLFCNKYYAKIKIILDSIEQTTIINLWISSISSNRGYDLFIDIISNIISKYILTEKNIDEIFEQNKENIVFITSLFKRKELLNEFINKLSEKNRLVLFDICVVNGIKFSFLEQKYKSSFINFLNNIDEDDILLETPNLINWYIYEENDKSWWELIFDNFISRGKKV